jgi:hypothetical protein
LCARLVTLHLQNAGQGINLQKEIDAGEITCIDATATEILATFENFDPVFVQRHRRRRKGRHRDYSVRKIGGLRFFAPGTPML